MQYFQILFLFFFTLVTSPLKADMATLTFQELSSLQDNSPKKIQKSLSKYRNQAICMRGFLYQKDMDTWILSPEPNLKTCCVGSKQKIKNQVMVSGSFDNPNRDFPVTMQGTFKIDPTYDESYNLTALYKIEKASILQVNDNKKHSSGLWIYLALIGALFFIFVLALRIKYRN